MYKLYTPTWDEILETYPVNQRDPFTGVNYWVASDKIIFAQWSIHYQNDASVHEKLRHMVEVIKTLSVAEKLSLDTNWESNSHDSVPTLIQLSSLVSYYQIRGTHLEQRHIGNLGLLLSDIRAEENFASVEKFTCGISPIHIKVSHDEYSSKIKIVLNTDIWFAWVVGFLEKKPATHANEMYDNRRLAFWHTLHLNTFIMKLKEEVANQNAIWQCDTNAVHSLYSHVVTEDGIILHPENRINTLTSPASE